jgi:hypothetical protein
MQTDFRRTLLGVLSDDMHVGEIPRSEPDWRCLHGSG